LLSGAGENIAKAMPEEKQQMKKGKRKLCIAASSCGMQVKYRVITSFDIDDWRVKGAKNTAQHAKPVGTDQIQATNRLCMHETTLVAVVQNRKTFHEI
jgi:hypothetical protein